MKKSDAELLRDLRGLVARERVLMVDLLRHLREVECRRLYLARGYSSLFEFCQRELGYSNPEAQYRISAMRLMKDVPEVEEKLAAGDISLTVAATVQSTFRGKDISLEEKQKVLASVTGLSSRAAERKLAETFPEQPKREVARAVGGGDTRIAFTASESLMEKLSRLKEILAHKNYDGRFDLLFEELADIALKKLEVHDAPSLRAPKVKHSRYVPVIVKRKAHSGCEYVDPVTKRRCGTRHGLQFDHIKPYAEGGTNAPDNFQRLCGPHNRYKSRTS